MSRDTFHYTRLLRAPSNLALDTSREGVSTTSLGNPFPCLTTLIVKNLFLISNLIYSNNDMAKMEKKANNMSLRGICLKISNLGEIWAP